MKRTQSKHLGILTGLATAAVVSCATPGGGAHAQLRSAAEGYELEVLVDGGPAPQFFHAGESYVMGHMGQRYTLRIWNRSNRRIEAVVAVDGRDVIDGKAGEFRHKRGYLVPAWGSVDIDGWRLSERQAAAFRFTSVANSYAGRVGSVRNVGVIGVAVFPERERVYRPRPQPIEPRRYPYPGDGDYRSEAGAPEAERSSSAPAPAPSARPGSGSGEGALADAAPAKSKSAARGRSAEERPGLGTEFGEAVHSPIQEVYFVRASSSSPAVTLGVRYNDRAGLLAMGVDLYRYEAHRPQMDDSYLRSTANPFPVSHRRYAPPPAGWRR